MYDMYVKLGNNVRHNQEYKFIMYGEIYRGRWNKHTQSFHTGKRKISRKYVTHIQEQ